jgi:pyridoxal phosphate enzyme (YggS family)
MSQVAEALRATRTRLERALLDAGRPRDAARLIAVSKQQPLAAIRTAFAAGQLDFGESYAQELDRKARELRDLTDLRWHFIGKLQTNKAKLVAPVAELIHSIDSLGLAQALLRRSGGRRIRCLVEINVAREPQKAGILPAQAGDFCRALLALPSLSLEGLMCLPPETEPPRPHFEALRALRDDLEARLDTSLPELSMGMSSDFEQAAAAGATLVRVGTALFGPRSRPEEEPTQA